MYRTLMKQVAWGLGLCVGLLFNYASARAGFINIIQATDSLNVDVFDLDVHDYLARYKYTNNLPYSSPTITATTLSYSLNYSYGAKYIHGVLLDLINYSQSISVSNNSHGLRSFFTSFGAEVFGYYEYLGDNHRVYLGSDVTARISLPPGFSIDLRAFGTFGPNFTSPVLNINQTNTTSHTIEIDQLLNAKYAYQWYFPNDNNGLSAFLSIDVISNGNIGTATINFDPGVSVQDVANPPSPSGVPEPSSVVLLGIGVVGFFQSYSRGRRRQADSSPA
jgi:hypothetical protein